MDFIMDNKNQSAASKVRKVAMEFIEKNAGKEFKRKELEEYIDQQITVTSGEKTGSLNRLLLKNGAKNGIFQVERGVYVYDPTKKNDAPEDTIIEDLQQIMDSAFEQARKVINSIEIVDMLTDDDLDTLAQIRELLKMKEKIDEILNVED